MKDFNRLIDVCTQEVKAARIPIASEIEWVIDRRSKKRWGQCMLTPQGDYQIKIAARLLEDDQISEEACKDTMIHELLHTCPDCMKHTGTWKMYADWMNHKYGYHIKRVTSGKEKGVEDVPTDSLPVQYVFQCKYCGQIIRRKKKCKFTKYYKNYGCGICGQARCFVKLKEE